MPRYAIYFIPDPASALWAFGSSVVGYDSGAGRDVPFPSHPVFQNEAARAWTEAPRRYGFHATLKAPFELREEVSEAQLQSAFEAFCATRAPVGSGDLRVSEIGKFLALVPIVQSHELSDFAGECVRAFEPFRAPLSEADLARRRSASLTARQVSYLEAWGYPYVFDAFRFHMTLSGSLADEERGRMKAALETLHESIAQPLVIDAVGLCYQPDRDSRFRVLQRVPLRG